MKKIIIIIGIISLVILAIGCTDNTENGTECTRDSDCVKAGCSSTLCQSKDSEQGFTTCEWKEEYACYQEATCGCVNGYCNWKDSDLESCIEEKRTT